MPDEIIKRSLGCYTENTHCPKCDEFDPRSIERVGLCSGCYSKEQPLIKADNHYVPWDYHYDGGNGKEREIKYRTDANAALPSIEWCNVRKKFKVLFTAADIGGYDVENMVWYFDSTDDILDAMGIKMCKLFNSERNPLKSV